MDPLLQWFVAAAAGVTATAASGTCVASVAIYRLVKAHERTLHGAENHDSWSGLVADVAEIRVALEREGLL